MKYQHTFEVNAPLETVAQFHSASNSMAAITPPPVIVQIHQAPAQLSEGSEMDFTLWLGPFPLRWLARMEDVTPNGFTDRQIRGPFSRWIHRHGYEALDDNSTIVVDTINLKPRKHLLWGPVGLGMRLSLPALFAYRAWRTKRLLENQ